MASRRYRLAMAPHGMGDELRVALMLDGTCWGCCACTGRTAIAGFDPRDARLLAVPGPLVASALRRALVTERALVSEAWDGPGVAVLNADRSVRTSTAAATRWLSELADLDRPHSTNLPTAILGVVEQLNASVDSGPASARARVCAPSGLWLTVHHHSRRRQRLGRRHSGAHCSGGTRPDHHRGLRTHQSRTRCHPKAASDSPARRSPPNCTSPRTRSTTTSKRSSTRPESPAPGNFAPRYFDREPQARLVRLLRSRREAASPQVGISRSGTPMAPCTGAVTLRGCNRPFPGGPTTNFSMRADCFEGLRGESTGAETASGAP